MTATPWGPDQFMNPFFTRRSFLQATSLSTAAIALGPGSVFTDQGTATEVPASRLKRLSAGANICRWFRHPRSESEEHFANYLGHAEADFIADPNDWAREHNQPRYILDLLKRPVRVSLETMKIVNALPALHERKSREENAGSGDWRSGISGNSWLASAAPSGLGGLSDG